MMKRIVCVMLGSLLFACGNKEAQPEATSPTATTSAPVASTPAASTSASTTPAPVTSASAASSSSDAGAADPGVIIQIKGNLILVDGSPAGALGGSLDELSAKLKSTRDTWMKVHPGQPFPGRVTLKVEKGTPVAGITHMVDVAHTAGYPNAAVANP